MEIHWPTPGFISLRSPPLTAAALEANNKRILRRQAAAGSTGAASSFQRNRSGSGPLRRASRPTDRRFSSEEIRLIYSSHTKAAEDGGKRRPPLYKAFK